MDIIHDEPGCLLKYVTRNIFRDQCVIPLPSVCDRPLESQVSTARANRDSSSPSRNLPALRHNIPCREVETRERHRYRRRLAGSKEDAVEAFQVERRALGGSRRRGVQLRDLEEEIVKEKTKDAVG